MIPWKLRIDVGGTFCDGWALLPDGSEKRCKVLSYGVLRTRVASSKGGWITCSHPLSDYPSGLEGFVANQIPILDSRPDQGRFKIEGDFSPGELLTIGTGEDAAVVAARILTGTAPGNPFPECEIRVATTRGTNALLEGKGEPVQLFVTSGFETLLEVRDQRRPDLFELSPTLAIPITREVIGVSGRLNRQGEIIDELDLSSLPEKATGNGVAVALINSDVAPHHEKKVGEVLRERGFENVSLSHQLAPVIRYWPRMETAVANAYLTPVMSQFVDGIRDTFPGKALSLMASSGRLKQVESFRPIDSLLSGPAGGLAGAGALAKAAGCEKILTLDMGGTSTDVARIEGQPQFRYEQEIGPVKVLAPAVRIETVAAGGGSICSWRNGGLEVGPESAGSQPGPACYGQGGPLTVTDVNLLLGLMKENTGELPLDRTAAQDRLDELMSKIDDDIEQVDLLLGLRRIAISHMADALRLVSTREGYDCFNHALVAFGGAGPQHACGLADELGIETILIPADAGLLSAWGLEQAGDGELRTLQILKPLSLIGSIADSVSDLAKGEPVARCLHEMRLSGQDSTLEIKTNPDATSEELAEMFSAEYRKVYRSDFPTEREIELVAIRIELVGSSRELPKEIFGDPEFIAEDRIEQDGFSTLSLEKGWSAARGSQGSWRLTRKLPKEIEISSDHDLIRAELFRRRFENIAAEMGELLRRTALSTNIKERLDFSCALLDSQGRLVVNAPHIPVHLGALGLCVRQVTETLDEQGEGWREGESIVVNHPAFGGSHLPDITVVTPVFVNESILCFVANRAHHAEIGGTTPGSMPPNARTLSEEGIVIPPTRYREIDITTFAGSRSPADNLADLAAQVAANTHGVEAMKKLSSSCPVSEINAQIDNLYQRAAAVSRELQKDFSEGRAEDSLDDGSVIKVRCSSQNNLKFDFRGSSGTHAGNLNATPAIVRSAVLYVLRLWSGEDLPLNEGLLDGVEIVTEKGILNPPLLADPAKCPAVVGGNVETSQRIVDVLLEALNLQSNGQGTMNNLLFGNSQFGFYETIGGGAGAGPGWHGRSGCHVHMSNTAITDVEILEERFPVRVHHFGIRQESGGDGFWRGGDGLIREIEFLEPVTVSILSQRRTLSPKPNGKAGRQEIFQNGKWSALPGVVSLQVSAGERIRILTPGGGGWLQDRAKTV